MPNLYRAPRRLPWVSLVLVGLIPLAGSGCALLHHRGPTVTAPFGEAAAVFVADGAGNFQGCSSHFRDVFLRDHLPLRLEVVPWSHGDCKIIPDQTDYPYARARGAELAQRLLEYRAQNPSTPIHLVGHSAGATVILAALENLPPDVVDRAFLLSPSLSVYYDLRPALARVRHGLHVYYSRRDCCYLGVGTRIVGNADRIWGPSGGRYGFRVYVASPEDADLMGKLYQRPWTWADYFQTHNNGGHYGFHQPEYIRLYIVPHMLP